jgi:hypothetical protein
MGINAAAPSEELRLHRPFGWGLAVVLDSWSRGAPELTKASLVSSTESGLSILVRHAQDVELDGLKDTDEVHEFSVSLHARVGGPTEALVAFDGVIGVPSGQITIGDADREDTLVIAAGLWRVQVALTPEDYAEHVDIWFSEPSVR